MARDIDTCGGRYVATQLDICLLSKQSIYARVARIRYVAFGNERSIAPQTYFSRFAHRAKHIERVSAISNAKRISSDASAAHIDVESACQRHDRFDVSRRGEQIKRLDALRRISILTENANISCECCGITRNVNYSLRIEA